MRLIDDDLPLEAALDESVAVMLLSHVNYRSGQMHDMAAVTALAHERGALAIWDLAHAAGAVPVDLNGADADFAVGCTYKYLNGGPGSPAFIWVAPRPQDFWQPLSGWWGHTQALRHGGRLRARRRHPALPVRHPAHRVAVAGGMRAGRGPCGRHGRGARNRSRWATCSSRWSTAAAPATR